MNKHTRWRGLFQGMKNPGERAKVERRCSTGPSAGMCLCYFVVLDVEVLVDLASGCFAPKPLLFQSYTTLLLSISPIRMVLTIP